jgi:hypothetical protein
MGLNNEMELALFLSGDLEDARGPVKTTEDFKELAEQTRNFQTFMDELKQFAAGMAEDMGPVLDWIKDLIHNFTKYAGVIKAVIGTLSLMVVAIQAVSAAQAALAIATAFATGGANIWAGIAAITAAGTVLAGAHYMQSQITGAAGVAAEGPKSAKDKGRPTLHKGGYGTGEMTEVQQGELAHVEQDTYLSPRGAFNPYTLSSAYDSRANAGGRGGGGMPDVHVTVKIGDKEFNELVNSVEIKKYVGGGGASKMWASATKIPFSGPA